MKTTFLLSLLEWGGEGGCLYPVVVTGGGVTAEMAVGTLEPVSCPEEARRVEPERERSWKWKVSFSPQAPSVSPRPVLGPQRAFIL